MDLNDKKIKENIISASQNVKNKLNELRNQQFNNEMFADELLRPITKKMDNLNGKKSLKANPNKTQLRLKTEIHAHDMDSNSIKSEYSEEEDDDDDVEEDDDSTLNKSNESEEFNTPSSSKVVSKVFSSSPVAIPFGIRVVNDKIYVGNKELILTEDLKKVKIGNRDFYYTPGLEELLKKKIPNEQKVTQADKDNYRKILEYTSAHKRGFDYTGQIKGNKSIKYRKFIKPLFKNYKCNAESVGEGIRVNKILKSNTDFIYWDNPNELVERLKLLLASETAGNNGHKNEILSIIEELREGNYIK